MQYFINKAFKCCGIFGTKKAPTGAFSNYIAKYFSPSSKRSAMIPILMK